MCRTAQFSSPAESDEPLAGLHRDLQGNIRERERQMRVAVVGSGLSGLVAAHELARSGGVRVTVYEKEDHLGGAKTVAVDGGAEEGRVLVDLGPVVFNPVRNMHACTYICTQTVGHHAYNALVWVN
jgi:predicted NAD/FAD-binding protein